MGIARRRLRQFFYRSLFHRNDKFPNLPTGKTEKEQRR
jgi:hypothetical protein